MRWTRARDGVALGLLALLVGCATTGPRQSSRVGLAPAAAVGPFVLESTGGRQGRREALEALREVEVRIEEVLGLRLAADSGPIRVLVLDDQLQLTRLMESTHPELPVRRAFFLAEDGERVIYASDGDRLGEDLRHEATHAVLNGTVGTLPLWIDEGLAEYFEVAEGDRAEVERRCAELRGEIAKGWRPDLDRLASIDSIRDLTSADYREAWAWARLIVEADAGSRLVLAGGSTSPSDRLAGAVAGLGSDRPELERAFQRSLEPSARPPSRLEARTQSPEPDLPAPLPVPRRTILGRLADRLGSIFFGS